MAPVRPESLVPSEDRTSTTRRPSRSWRGWSVLGALIGITAFVLAPSGPAGAVHDLGLFELDGNALDDANVPGDDWNSLFPTDTSSLEFAKVFVADGTGVTELNAFAGGQTKDVNDLDEWGHAAVDTVPNNDDLTNAYAAAYLDDSGDVIVYFGADKLASGQGAVGFWFFKDQVAALPDGTFSGVHQNGDILVVADFSNGGNVGTINVYEWNTADNDNANGPLDLLVAGAECATSEDVCGIVNVAATPAPWPHPAGANFPANTFFEGGINLTDIIGSGSQICFSTFLAESRSSTAENSSLQDFALGGFELCDLTVEKNGDELAKVGDPVNYTITIKNSGLVDLFMDDIIDPLLADPVIVLNGVINATNSEVTSIDCEALLEPGDSCTITLTRTVLDTDPDPLVNDVTVTYNSAAGPTFTGITVSDATETETNLFEPAVEVLKSVDPELSKVGDEVTYTFRVNNLSSSDSPDLIVDSIDDPLLGGDLLDAAPAECDSLAFEGFCEFTVDYTIQPGDADPLDNTATVHYHPEGFNNDITDTDTARVNLFQPGVTVEKDGPASAAIGETVTYTFTVNNTSSADTPALILDSIFDPLIGTLTIPADCNALDAGESCEFTADRTVLAGDPDPLVNTVTVHYHPTGFQNDITDDDDHALTVLSQGTIIVKKVADEYDTDVEFPFSSNFDGDANDGADFSLEAGEERTFALDAGTFSVTELVPNGWNLVSAVCSDQSLVSAIVLSPEETITCTFTNKKEVNDYNDYPGDDDFDIDTPFDDAGEPGIPAPTGDTAGTNDQVGTQQPAAPAPVVENNTTSQPQPNPAAPVALDQLPRTGQGLDRITVTAGLLLIMGGIAVLAGGRRRRAHRA